MKLEQQVVSLDLAKQLKELGVKQESLFWWRLMNYGMENIYEIVDWHDGAEYEYSAFTVAELGEMLPHQLLKDEIYSLHSLKINGWTWGIEYKDEDTLHSEVAGTEANARAKMLIYLIENELIDIKEQ